MSAEVPLSERWDRVNALREEVAPWGYVVLRRPEVTVQAVERLGEAKYRADVSVHVNGLGRMNIRRVYFQAVTDTAGRHWQLAWPTRHAEGSPIGLGAKWVKVASLTGALADAVSDALLAAIEP